MSPELAQGTQPQLPVPQILTPAPTPLPAAVVVKEGASTKPKPMSDRSQRSFVALDEWGGILVLVYLHKYDPALFWPFLIPWAVAVYGISYPWLWWRQYRAEKAA